MSKRNFFLKALLLLIIFCLPLLFARERGRLKVCLEEVLSIGGLDDDSLFQWVGVVSDSSNIIYVTDAMDYSLKNFDAQGNLLKKTGQKGQGPGEFLAPRYLDCSELFLYVTDQYIPGIQIFDKNLKYRSRIPIFIPITDLKVISDKEIAVATLSMDKSKKGKIFIFHPDGEITREIEYADRESPLMMDMVDFDFGPQGSLYLAYNFQDRIEKFDPEGKKLWSKKLLGIKKPKKQKIRSFTVPSKYIYKDLALNSSGHLFVLGGSYSKNPSQDVYILSSEGELLTTLTLPDSSHCIYIDGQDFLYSRANQGVTLKKFRMRYIYE